MGIKTDNYTIIFNDSLAKWLVSLYLIYILAGHCYHEVKGVAWLLEYWLMDLEAAFWGIVAAVTNPKIWRYVL